MTMKPDDFIPLSRPSYGLQEQEAVLASLARGQCVGNGPAGKRAALTLARMTGAASCLLTPSCTHALELALMTLGVGPDDEVLVPSFTFVSTANAVVVRGARPVFCDLDPATLAIDPEDAERRIGPRTRGIIPVHYAGVPADMDAIARLAERHGLFVLEDAAQALGSSYHGRACGTLGDMGAFSFHETKNVSCGEGGALLFRDPALARRAEIHQEKGTNRSAFLRGEVDKYTWVEAGSSQLLSDLLASVLEVQLARMPLMQAARERQWNTYAARLADLEAEGLVRLPFVPPGCRGNAHIFHLRVADESSRDALIAGLKARGIGAAFHFVPLHSSPFAVRTWGPAERLPRTEEVAATLLRLPLYAELTESQQERVVDAVRKLVRARTWYRKAS